MRRRLDFVVIYWRDAEADPEWGPDSSDPAPPVFSSGWVLERPNKENAYRWLIAADIGDDALDPEADKNRKFKVPRGMIDHVDRVGYFDGKIWFHEPEPLTPSGRPQRRRAKRCSEPSS